MAKRIQWAYRIAELRASTARSQVETYARRDIEHLFSLGRVQAQQIMRAVGGRQAVAGAHFVERPALLAFLDEMAEAPSVAEGLRARLAEAEPAPRRKPLRVRLPAELRTAMLPDLPENVRLAPGRLEIDAPTAEAMVEALMRLALVMQNDDRWCDLIEPPAPPPPVEEEELQGWLAGLRARHADLGGPL